MYGDLINKYIEKLSGENKKTIKNLKEKYLVWRDCKDIEKLIEEYRKYGEYFSSEYDKIRKAISERQFTVLIGSRTEEFCAALLEILCKKTDLKVEKMGREGMISWLGFDTRKVNEFKKIQRMEHGADIAVGKWESLKINDEKENYFIPRIIIECKQYIDITKLRDISFESEMWKKTYPYTPFFAVCETLEVTEKFEKLIKVWTQFIDEIFTFRHSRERTIGPIEVERVNEFVKKIKEIIESTS
jgi:hypothetical protein